MLIAVPGPSRKSNGKASREWWSTMTAERTNSPSIRVMIIATRPFRHAWWGQGLALVLAGALLLQGGPVRVLVQAAGQAGANEPCRHHARQEVCPRNPDGPCTCTHHDTQDHSSESETPEGPAFEACNGADPGALSPGTSPLGWTPVRGSRPSPHIYIHRYAHRYSTLSPQRVGDDVFRPPRTTPDVRLA
jgi:hypothetical protein